MIDIEVNIQGEKNKMINISYKEQIKIPLKVLYKDGYINREEEVSNLSDEKLKNIIKKYRDSKIKILPSKIKGGKHVIHQS